MLSGFVVGLGANLGDRRLALRSAVAALRGLGEVRAVSALFETTAVGPPQPDYLNAAVELEYRGAPLQLLDALLAIERAHGRARRVKWGPRTLDLDLLYSPGIIVSEPGLELPHPELRKRAFALLPLLEVAPAAVDPLTGEAYAEIARHLDTRGVQRLLGTHAGAAEWWA
jgi:2-amino-4-hydroxy-6-hydroxymethyldihydropteridine diphosphokinase